MSKVVARNRSSRKNRRPVATAKTFPPQKNEWAVLTFADITAWQKKHKLSNSALCRILDIGPNSYYNWKRGTNAPSTGLQQMMLKVINQDDPVDPKYAPRTVAISKQEIQESFEDTHQPASRDGEVAMEIEIAAIQATSEIICSRLENGTGLKDSQLIQLTGSIQQALLGDF